MAGSFGRLRRCPGTLGGGGGAGEVARGGRKDRTPPSGRLGRHRYAALWGLAGPGGLLCSRGASATSAPSHPGYLRRSGNPRLISGGSQRQRPDCRATMRPHGRRAIHARHRWAYPGALAVRSPGDRLLASRQPTGSRALPLPARGAFMRPPEQHSLLRAGLAGSPQPVQRRGGAAGRARIPLAG